MMVKSEPQKSEQEERVQAWSLERFPRGSETPWVDLVGHRHYIEASATMKDVRARFSELGVEFLAILNRERLVGLCSRSMISDTLSKGYQGVGFPLYARRPVIEFMLPRDFRIPIQSSPREILGRIVRRQRDAFFDDVILVGKQGEYLGLISAHSLVALQNAILEEQQRELQKALEEQRKLATELQERKEELELLNEEKNEFLGIAAHDLKNPINAIKMSVELLLDYGDTMEVSEQKEILSTAVVGCSSMTKLIQDLLDVNRIEGGRACFEIEPCDLCEVVESSLANYEMRADAKRQKLVMGDELSEATVMADRNYLVQVLDNLVSNAVKYSPEEATIQVFLRRAQTGFELGVRDQGPGISEQDQKKLFVKFQRLSARPTGGESSTGLGLSIVKRLIEGMHGAVRCESDLGEGATFIVTLPAAD